MSSEKQDVSSIGFMRFLHIIACMLVLFVGGICMCKIEFPSHSSGSNDGAGMAALGFLMIFAIIFIVVLVDLIIIHVVAQKKSINGNSGAILLGMLMGMFWVSPIAISMEEGHLSVPFPLVYIISWGWGFAIMKAEMLRESWRITYPTVLLMILPFFSFMLANEGTVSFSLLAVVFINGFISRYYDDKIEKRMKGID